MNALSNCICNPSVKHYLSCQGLLTLFFEIFLSICFGVGFGVGVDLGVDVDRWCVTTSWFFGVVLLQCLLDLLDYPVHRTTTLRSWCKSFLVLEKVLVLVFVTTSWISWITLSTTTTTLRSWCIETYLVLEKVLVLLPLFPLAPLPLRLVGLPVPPPRPP